LTEELDDLRIKDFFSPKTKLLFLISKLAENNVIEKEVLQEEVFEADSELNILNDYSSEHSAKNAFKHHLDSLEKEGIIEQFEESGVKYIRVKRKIPCLGLFKIDKMFSNNVIVGCLIIAFLIVFVSLIMLDTTMIVMSIITLVMMISIFFSYRLKIVI